VRLGLWLTCLFVIATFLRPQELFLELAPYNLMDILGGLALAATLLDILAGARPRLWQVPVVLLVAFVFWAAVSVVASLRWPGGAALAFQSLSINMFVFALTVLHGSELTRQRAIRGAAIVALLLTVGLGLRAYYLGPRFKEFVLVDRAEGVSSETGEPRSGSDLIGRLTGRRSAEPAPGRENDDASPEADEAGGPPPAQWVRRLRALGFLNDPNDLAQTLVAALPLVMLAWRPGRPFVGLLFAIAPAALMVWAILLTRSRGGLVALAVLAYLTLIRRLGPRWVRGLQIAGVVGLLAGLVVFFRLGADDSALGRLEAWSMGLQMLRQSPIWGVGYSNFLDHHDIVAHNSFVHCFAELGVVGYFLWLAALVSTFWLLQAVGSPGGDGPRTDELVRLAVALRLSLASYLAGALFLSRSYSVSLFFLLGLSAAVVSVARRFTAPLDRRFAIPVPRLTAVTGALVVASIVTTYLIVRISR